MIVNSEAKTPDRADYETLSVVSDGRIDRLTLNRPDQLNAMNRRMTAELQHYFNSIANSTTVRVVILASAGQHFCAGMDLADLNDALGSAKDPMLALHMQRGYSNLIRQMRRCPQPIIALVRGSASGIGFAIALAADVRYAASDAKMNVAMAKVGLTGCDVGISYFLPRVVGASNAAELMMSGRFVDAERALRLGLISDIATPQDLDELGNQLAGEMVRMSPAGLRMTKEGLNASLDGADLETVFALEDRGQVLCLGAYLEEGARAFLEKRPANYCGSDSAE